MTYPLSRFMSAATASYGAFCLVKPRHLGDAMKANPVEKSAYDVLAYTYGARDIPISALGMFGRSGRVVTAAMMLRIAIDLSDGVVLSVNAKDSQVRTKVLGATLGWATLNTVALLLDRRRA